MVDKRYRVDLKSKNNKEFFLIHGYSGSPTDFGELPTLLHKQFNASVKCEILPGHCTNLEDLNTFELEQFIKNVEDSLKKELALGKKIVLVGISFGAQLALYFASKYPIEGVILCSITHILKFPFNIPGISLFRYIKKNVPKNYHPNEQELRKKAFYYEAMPSKALILSKKLRKLTEPHLKTISAPIFFVHSTKEPLGSEASADYIFKKVASKVKGKYLTDVKNHNLFYSNKRKEVVSSILEFITKNKLLNKNHG
jgi:esterase/lipase